MNKDMTFRIATQGYIAECEKYTYNNGEVICYNGRLKQKYSSKKRDLTPLEIVNLQFDEKKEEERWCSFVELHLNLRNSEYMIVDYAPFQ